VIDDRNGGIFIDTVNSAPVIQKYLPELVADMWELGSYPGIIVDLIAALRLPAKVTHVLDLACGKGAVGITLAEFFGFNVLGIDIRESFIKDARIQAKEHGVENLSQFQTQDLRQYIKKPKGFDLVVYASAGPIMGNLADTLWHLRRTVHAGGYILIDDAFLTKGAHLYFDGYTHFLSHHASREALTKWGDTIITEREIDRKMTAQMNRRYIRSLKRNSGRLIRKLPDLQQLIEDFIKKQSEECRIIETHLTECMWLIQKRS
jgi:cyclopropane fatty-acyl-phospholipid synthase-like methyltransferase